MMIFYIYWKTIELNSLKYTFLASKMSKQLTQVIRAEYLVKRYLHSKRYLIPNSFFQKCIALVINGVWVKRMVQIKLIYLENNSEPRLYGIVTEQCVL